MSETVFLDSVGLLATWNRRDQWHLAAKQAFGKIVASRVRLVTTPFVLLECGNAAARYGDILLNEGQSMELVGRPAMYRDEVSGSCFTNTLVRFLAYEGLDRDFAMKVFLAYLKHGRFQQIASITVNIAHLGAGRFADLEFPLPPLEEQHEIVREAERQLTLIDATETLIEANLKRAARLRQSILKRAFDGKLVPQDPTDEPATALLEHIRMGRNDGQAIASRTKGPNNQGGRASAKRKAANFGGSRTKAD